MVAWQLLRRYPVVMLSSWLVFFLVGSMGHGGDEGADELDLHGLVVFVGSGLAVILVGYCTIVEYYRLHGYGSVFDRRTTRAEIARFWMFTFAHMVYLTAIVAVALLLVTAALPISTLVVDGVATMVSPCSTTGRDEWILIVALAMPLPFYCLAARVSIFLCAVALNEYLTLDHYRRATRGIGLVMLVSIVCIHESSGLLRSIDPGSSAFVDFVLSGTELLLAVFFYQVLSTYYIRTGSKLGVPIAQEGVSGTVYLSRSSR